VVLTIASSVAIAVLVVGMGIAGVRALQTAPTPADPPPPTPTPESVGDLAYAVNGDIYVAEWDGSNPVRIADGRPPSDCRDIGEYWAEGPVWSPDGRYLAYRHTDCEGARDSWWDVVISDAEGNVVTSFPSEGWSISWSPDSTRVAVWDHWGGEPRTIGIYGLNGERQTLLTLPFAIGPVEADPVWSPDGESLLLGNFEIPLDGSTPRPLPWAEPTARDVVAGWARDWPEMKFAPRWDPVWSPAGDRIAFTPTSRGSIQLRVLDVATGTATLLTEVDASNRLHVIDFSPQGDRILFLSIHLDGAGAALWSVNVDGSDLRRLVAGTASGDWLSPTQAG
jgi:Tol biopolymer transport system component